MAGNGTVTVKILGDAKGLKGALGDSESKLAKFGKVAGAAFVAAGAAAVGVGVGLFKLGSSFDDAYDKIRVGTGATGKDLDGLEASFKNVVKSVPTDFEKASTAIADLNTRTGLTGPALEDLSRRTLELSRLTGTDLSTTIEGTTRLFGDWGIASEDQAATLDKLFRASQATGIGVDQLAQSAVQFGAPLRAMGFSLEETTALLGKFEKEGVNGEIVMGAFRKGLATFAKEGEDAPKALARLTEEIKNAKTPTEGTALAMEVFGSKAGPDMAAAIREGRFDLGELLDTVSSGEETILGAAADTADFSEKWQMFKNRVLVGLEPLAAGVFNAVGTAMDRIGPPAERAAAWLSERIPVAMEAVRTFVETRLVPILERLGAWWDGNGPMIVATATAIGEGVVSALGGLVDAARWVVEHWNTLQPVVLGIAALIAAVLIPHYVALGVAAVVSSAKQVQAWVVSHAKAAWAVVQHSAQVVAMVAKWIFLGAQSLVHAAVVVAGWAMTAAGAVANVAIHVAQVGVAVAKWAFLGAQSLLHAAKVAAAWLIAMGPIAIVIAAIAGLVVVVVKNWDTIKEKTVAAWNAVVALVGDAWTRTKTAVSDGIAAVVTFVSGLPGKIVGAIGDLGRLLYGKGRDVVQGLINGIKSMAGSVASAIANAIPGGGILKGGLKKGAEILGFDTGGVVPGPKGSPQLILAHGGETILPTHKAPLSGFAGRPAVGVSGGGTVEKHFHLHVAGTGNVRQDFALMEFLGGR